MVDTDVFFSRSGKPGFMGIGKGTERVDQKDPTSALRLIAQKASSKIKADDVDPVGKNYRDISQISSLSAGRRAVAPISECVVLMRCRVTKATIAMEARRSAKAQSPIITPTSDVDIFVTHS